MVDANQQQDAGPYLKVKEVATMFGVTSATVREWLNDGTLEGIKIGKGHYWRISTAAAQRLAQKRYGDDA